MQWKRENSCREITNHKTERMEFCCSIDHDRRENWKKWEERTQWDHTKCKSVSKLRQTNTRYSCHGIAPGEATYTHTYWHIEQVRFFIFLRIIISVTKTNCYSHYVGTCTEFVYYEVRSQAYRGEQREEKRKRATESCRESKWIDGAVEFNNEKCSREKNWKR